MSFELVEQLKRQYTDKWVVVEQNTAELRRFVGLSGQVKTINMNGRALVQFDGPVDISWYDIDLNFLKVIDAPLPKKAVEHKAEPAEKKPAAAAAPKAAGGKSPLELAREQAAKAQAAKAGTGDAPAKKSPLELAREQAAKALAAKAAAAAPAPAATPEPVVEAPPEPVAPAAPAPAAVSMTDADGKPLSKIELARRQGAAKRP